MRHLPLRDHLGCHLLSQVYLEGFFGQSFDLERIDVDYTVVVYVDEREQHTDALHLGSRVPHGLSPPSNNGGRRLERVVEGDFLSFLHLLFDPGRLC